MIGELILGVMVVVAGYGVNVWARWSAERLDRNDPARHGSPAE